MRVAVVIPNWRAALQHVAPRLSRMRGVLGPAYFHANATGRHLMWPLSCRKLDVPIHVLTTW